MYFHNFILKVYYMYKFFTYIFISLIFFSASVFSIEVNKEFIFLSLKYDALPDGAHGSKLRIGPGKKFPISWRLVRKGLPVKLIERFEDWRKIELHDGTIGWINVSQLTKKRTIICISKAKIYSKPTRNSSSIADVEIASILELKNCNNKWCKVHSVEYNITGYILKEKVWGINLN